MSIITPTIYEFCRQLPESEDSPLIQAVRELAVAKPKVGKDCVEKFKCKKCISKGEDEEY